MPSSNQCVGQLPFKTHQLLQLSNVHILEACDLHLEAADGKDGRGVGRADRDSKRVENADLQPLDRRVAQISKRRALDKMCEFPYFGHSHVRGYGVLRAECQTLFPRI
jgi:hypothetical protein